MRKILAAGITLALLSGCRMGPSVRSYPPAQRGHGLPIEARLASGATVHGEVLALSDTAFLILQDGDLVLLRYERLRSVRFPDFRDAGYQGARPPSEWHVDRLRLMTRYPHGVSPELLASLLEAYGRERVREPTP